MCLEKVWYRTDDKVTPERAEDEQIVDRGQKELEL